MTMEKPSRADDARIEEALRKGDVMFKSALKRDEEARKRRTLAWAAITVGVLIFAALVLNAILLLNRPPAGAQAATAPANTDELTAEGWKLWQVGHMKTAAAKFTKAVELDPTNEAAWNGLGWACFNSGDADKGLKAFETLLKLNPNHAAGLNGMGQIYVLRGDVDKAEPFLVKAAPQAPAAWWGLVRVYLLKENYPEARKWAKRILDSGDKSIQPYLDAAKAEKVDDQLRQEMTPLKGK